MFRSKRLLSIFVCLFVCCFHLILHDEMHRDIAGNQLVRLLLSIDGTQRCGFSSFAFVINAPQQKLKLIPFQNVTVEINIRLSHIRPTIQRFHFIHYSKLNYVDNVGFI